MSEVLPRDLVAKLGREPVEQELIDLLRNPAKAVRATTYPSRASHYWRGIFRGVGCFIGNRRDPFWCEPVITLGELLKMSPAATAPRARLRDTGIHSGRVDESVV